MELQYMLLVKKQKRGRYATIIGTPEHDTFKKQKRDRHSAVNSNSEERIFKFTKQIQKGPYCVCVVCNRCHYFRSALLFKPEKYDTQRLVLLWSM